MTEPILTISLLIIVACNLGVLYLYFRVYQWTRTPAQLYSLWERIKRQNTKILRRIAQVKTRLADEERDDQREKRKERHAQA